MILDAGLVGRKDVRISVGTGLLVLVAFEASLLGSGRLLEIGPLTLKMWLFLAAQVYVIIRLIALGRVKLSTFAFLLSFTLLLLFGATIGLLQHSTMQLIGEDVSPLLYCIMLIFFEMVVKTEKHIRLIVRIIEFASVLMSIASLVVLTLLFLGVLSFLTLYGWLTLSSQEFFFRGQTGMFFYKGALYVGIGLIYFAFERNRFAKLAVVLTFIGLVATGTRGFFVDMAAIILVHVATGGLSLGKKVKYIGLLCISALVMLIIYQMAASNNVENVESDNVRIETLHQVNDRITPLSFVFGNGLGVGVPIRPEHMETAYMEIFHKQGLLGLTWWASVFMLLLMRYRKARRVNYLSAQPLFLSVIFVIVQSITNPFVNNPIGIFVWIFALVGLDIVSKNSSSAKLLKHRDCAAS